MSDNGNWLSHGFKRVPSLFEAQTALGWGVVVVLLTLLAVVYLSHASQTIASGFHMQQLAIELKELQKENTYLEAQIAAGQRVEQLRAQAIQLGFVPAGPEEIEYLPVDNYPPTPGQAAVTAPSQPLEATGGLVSWWGGLTRGFTGWTLSTAGEGD
jgi:hypothetical protein